MLERGDAEWTHGSLLHCRLCCLLCHRCCLRPRLRSAVAAGGSTTEPGPTAWGGVAAWRRFVMHWNQMLRWALALLVAGFFLSPLVEYAVRCWGEDHRRAHMKRRRTEEERVLRRAATADRSRGRRQQRWQRRQQ